MPGEKSGYRRENGSGAGFHNEPFEGRRKACIGQEQHEGMAHGQQASGRERVKSRRRNGVPGGIHHIGAAHPPSGYYPRRRVNHQRFQQNRQGAVRIWPGNQVKEDYEENQNQSSQQPRNDSRSVQMSAERLHQA